MFDVVRPWNVVIVFEISQVVCDRYGCTVDRGDVADGGHSGGRGHGAGREEGELARRMDAHLWPGSKLL